MSEKITTKLKGNPDGLLAKISTPWSPRDASSGLYPPLNLPTRHLSIDGWPYPIFCPENLVKQFIKGRSDDVFVTTYARSGTTLTLSICRHIHLQHNPNLPEDHPLLSDKRIIQAPWINNDFSPVDPEKMKSPRLFKTHNRYEHLNIDSEKSKVIHVFRNPKDVVCSLYPHTQSGPRIHFFDFQGTFEDSVEWFLKGGMANGCYWTHNKEYFMNERKYKILHINFEELTLKKRSAIQKINSFLGYGDLAEQQITAVEEATALNQLAPNQVGKPGSARRLLSFEQRSLFDARTEKEFDGIPYIPRSYTDESSYQKQS